MVHVYLEAIKQFQHITEVRVVPKLERDISRGMLGFIQQCD